MSNKERLNRLGLHSLRFERMHSDLIERCKILRRLGRVDAETSFLLLETLKPEGIVKIEIRRNFFFENVLNLWNSSSQWGQNSWVYLRLR